MRSRSILFIVFLAIIILITVIGVEARNFEVIRCFNQSDQPEVSKSIQESSDHALTYVKVNGKDGALKEFNNGSGRFVSGDQYVIAFDFNGTCLIHIFRPELIGENLIDFRDANGVLLNRNMNNVGSRGGGFTYYVRPNAQNSNANELKLSYIAKVNNEWWLGTGVWLSDIPAIFSAELRLSLVNMVDRAYAYALEHGKEDALKAFNNKNSDFVDGNYYIFALDFEGNVLAHPIQLDMVGRNRLDEQDHYGALYVRDLVDAATEGSGLVYYMYPEPEENMTQTIKLSYARKVDEDWWLGSGIYPNETLRAEDRKLSSFEPPDTRSELVAFVESAASYARIYGKGLATSDFMDLDGPFVREDVYIFAADFNGTSLALPFLPTAVGTNRLNLQNSEGVYTNREMRSIALNGSGFYEYPWTNPVTNETMLKTSYVTKVDNDWWLGAGIYLRKEEMVSI
jgi:signal transduction histidine kinase